jgi:endonuclease-3
MLSSQEKETLFKIFASKNPHPTTELQYTNTFTLLVAVVLSAQATDVGVNKATKALFEKVSTPQDILDLGLEGLISYVKTIGLYNAKAKNIMALSQILVDKYQGQVPSTREELVQLPGVGRKTANVILNVAFGQPTIAVDTHIFRVANRIGLTKGKTPLAVEHQLEKTIPTQYKHDAHHWLILHGRYVCKARKPLCPTCPVAYICKFPNKTV